MAPEGFRKQAFSDQSIRARTLRVELRLPGFASRSFYTVIMGNGDYCNCRLCEGFLSGLGLEALD